MFSSKSLLFLLLSSLAFSQSLPIKRVVLYKNGVGYLEHLGRVTGNQDVTVSFTSGQLDDVLKSLTVLDLNGGRIGGVTYGSSAPIDRQLADLRLPTGDKPTITEFLGALRGARIEIRSGTTVLTGRLLSMERKTRINGGNTLEIDYLSLLTANGELRTTELSPGFSVRLLDSGLSTKVDRFLDLAASSREPDLRRMIISTLGSGERSLFVSYISEVPVWKSTYRVVLPSKTGELPLLQGWAIIDNTVGQDWDNVQLSLVAGAPQSFIQKLSQPFYGRRPVVPIPEAAALSPQTFSAPLSSGPVRLSGTVTDPAGGVVPNARVTAHDPAGTLVGEAITDNAGRYEFASLADGNYRLTFEAPGFMSTSAGEVLTPGATARRDARLNVGSTSESVTVSADAPSLQASASRIGSGPYAGSMKKMALAPPPPPPTAAPVIAAARASAQAIALAQDLGDMFEYKIKEPITLRKNQSALVPIINARVGAEKVSIWNMQNDTVKPMRALWLHNNSGLTLDGGSFSVLENETFSGEGIFDPIRPNEKRLVSYATDLALATSARLASEPQRVTRVTVAKGVITHFSELREKKTYTARNADAAPRTVLIEHPVRQGYTLRAPAQPDETTPSVMRFRLQVSPSQTASLTVEEVKPISALFDVSGLSTERIAAFASSRTMTPELETVFRRVLAQKAALEQLADRKSALEDQAEAIVEDQNRLRENIKVLKSTAEEKALLQRYTRQLDEQETHLEQLRKEGEKLDAEISTAQAAFETFIQSLAFDVNL